MPNFSGKIAQNQYLLLSKNNPGAIQTLKTKQPSAELFLQRCPKIKSCEKLKFPKKLSNVCVSKPEHW